MCPLRMDEELSAMLHSHSHGGQVLTSPSTDKMSAAHDPNGNNSIYMSSAPYTVVQLGGYSMGDLSPPPRPQQQLGAMMAGGGGGGGPGLGPRRAPTLTPLQQRWEGYAAAASTRKWMLDATGEAVVDVGRMSQYSSGVVLQSDGGVGGGGGSPGRANLHNHHNGSGGGGGGGGGNNNHLSRYHSAPSALLASLADEAREAAAAAGAFGPGDPVTGGYGGGGVDAAGFAGVGMDNLSDLIAAGKRLAHDGGGGGALATLAEAVDDEDPDKDVGRGPGRGGGGGGVVLVDDPTGAGVMQYHPHHHHMGLQQQAQQQQQQARFVWPAQASPGSAGSHTTGSSHVDFLAMAGGGDQQQHNGPDASEPPLKRNTLQRHGSCPADFLDKLVIEEVVEQMEGVQRPFLLDAMAAARSPVGVPTVGTASLFAAAAGSSSSSGGSGRDEVMRDAIGGGGSGGPDLTKSWFNIGGGGGDGSVTAGSNNGNGNGGSPTSANGGGGGTSTLTRFASLPSSLKPLSPHSGGGYGGSDLSIPCRTRAKRGCATHPRSIAERVRRTRIGERMKRLQELLPNLDKQSNTADMLDEAVDYIKELKRRVEDLESKVEHLTINGGGGGGGGGRPHATP